MMNLHIVDKFLGKTPGKKRSPQWRKVRREFLKKHPHCASCGGTTKLEVHHIVPFHVDPSLELSFDNLMTLCRRKKYGIHCHLYVGHRGNYRKINPKAPMTALGFLRYLRGIEVAPDLR